MYTKNSPPFFIAIFLLLSRLHCEVQAKLLLSVSNIQYITHQFNSCTCIFRKSRKFIEVFKYEYVYVCTYLGSKEKSNSYHNSSFEAGLLLWPDMSQHHPHDLPPRYLYGLVSHISKARPSMLPPQENTTLTQI